MMQRCPKCGQWCEGNKQSIIDKAGLGYEEDLFEGGKIGESIGGRLGNPGKKIGGFLGTVVGSFTGLFNGAIESISGADYFFTCPNCGNWWEAYGSEADQTKEYQWEYELRDRFASIINASQQEKGTFLNELQSALGNTSNTEREKATLYAAQAATYYLLCKRNDATEDEKQEAKHKALDAVDSSLKCCDDANTHVLKGIIMGQGRNAKDTYAAMKEVIKYKSRAENLFFTTEQIKEEFDKLQNSFSQNFLSIPVQQRKYLVLCDEPTCFPKNFYVLPSTSTELPTDLIFPAGPPVNNKLYVRHPYRNNFYYPYEKYETLILRDEYEEFKRIMAFLGAKHIAVSDTFRNKEANSDHQQNKTHAGGDYAGEYGVNLSYETEYSGELEKELSDILETNDDYEIAEYPTIPPDLIWYHHRLEWKHKCESRLHNGLLHSEFIISTSSSEMTSESERENLEADLNALLLSANGEAEESKTVTLKKEQERTIKVIVDFYKLTDYGDKKIFAKNSLPTSAASLSNTLKKKINVVWIMGALIVALIFVILGLLFL